VSGLAVGNGLILQDNGANNLTVSANGSFTFATPLPSGSNYAVTVLTNSGSTAQNCFLSQGTGTVSAANVTSVVVTCTTDKFSIGGTVSGLAGTGFVLQDDGGDNLAVSANGSFTFATPLASGGTYSITVLNNPSNPAQTCIVSNGAGTVTAANITNPVVTCVTNKYTIGGTVSALTGTGLVLQDDGGDNLAVSANGSFTFATPLSSGGAYSITVLSNPSNPAQTCVVTNGSGTVGSANVTTVQVVCTTSNCPAQTINNCVVTTTNSGNTDTGTCSAGYSGSCSYSCSNGTFAQVTNTCAPAACSAQTINNCVVTTTGSGNTDAGTCSAGYSGSCSYSCSNGAFTQVTNTCANQCADNRKDGAETDVDCGGGTCAACAVGKSCILNSDCATNACDAVSLTCVASQCADHRQDGNETGVDCGGGTCTGCAAGISCRANSDCASNDCDTVAGVCGNACGAAGFCSPNVCQTTHTNGLGQSYYDCNPLNTFSMTAATEAATAYETAIGGSAADVSGGWSCPALPTITMVCATTGGNPTYCWDYSGAQSGWVVNGNSCSVKVGNTWN
jgi:hypothetical protein